VTDRRTVDTINDDQLSQLYDNLGRAETENAELRDALAHCHEREPRQRAEAALARVTDLQAQWLAAGPPPLGVPIARWWDARLVELHNAIRPAAEEPTP